MTPTLIYCADGNRRFAEIAIRHGYQYGAQLPHTIYFPPYFTDQDFKAYGKAREADRKDGRNRRAKIRGAYLRAVKQTRPALASVLDWEYADELPEVLRWAEIAARYVSEAVIIVPKVVGGIKRLPRTIGGRQVRLGYSTPTSFAGTAVELAEFDGWPVHVLGGSVAAQMEVARRANAVSADGNYAQRLALWCMLYSPAQPEQKHGWPRLSRLIGHRPEDSIYLSFELSCIAIPMAWHGYTGADIYEAQMSWLKSKDLAPEKQQARMF